MCHKACANACVTYSKPCIHMHANGEVYKRRGKLVRRGREQQKRKEGKKIEKKKKRAERERGKGGKGNRHSDGQNSSDQEVKFVYPMRATLQEVEFLPTLVYFPP